MTPFRRLAGREALATWNGRWRWAWRAAGVALVGSAALGPVQESWGPVFNALCLVAAWVPAWLGADLLSTRYRENPEPFREWRPRELLARAVGRLGPFILAQIAWTAVFTSRAVAQSPGLGRPADTVLAWVLVFQSSSVYLFALAALLSALARRPRRWAIVPPLLLAVAIGDHQIGPFPIMGQKEDVWRSLAMAGEWLPETLLAPNFGTGVGLGTELLDALAVETPTEGLAPLCLAASAAFLALTVVPWLVAWRIAAVRCARQAPAQGRGPPEENMQTVAP